MAGRRRRRREGERVGETRQSNRGIEAIGIYTKQLENFCQP